MLVRLVGFCQVIVFIQGILAGSIVLCSQSWLLWPSHSWALLPAAPSTPPLTLPSPPCTFPLPVKHAPVWLPTWSRPPPAQSPSPSRLVPLASVLPSPLLCPLCPGILGAACSVPCGVRVPACPWRHRGGGTLCLLALQPKPSIVVVWWLRAPAPGLSASCLGCIPGSLLNRRGL